MSWHVAAAHLLLLMIVVGVVGLIIKERYECYWWRRRVESARVKLDYKSLSSGAGNSRR